MQQTMTKLPKKMLPLMILEILQEYSDADHRMSQTEIGECLDKQFQMQVDRKAIKRNIDNLLEMGYPILYSEVSRSAPNQKTKVLEDNSIRSDYYLERDFTESEIRLLIDAILFSSHIPNSQRKRLIQKLTDLSNRYFTSHVKHVSSAPDSLPQSPQLFFTIEMLDEAIGCKKKIKFKYMKYDIDKKMHPMTSASGKIREYVVSPYQMAAKDGKYYLICNNDDFDGLSNYRVDRITDIEILDERIRSIKDLTGSKGDSLDLAKYMTEHIYMYGGDSIKVKFKITRDMVSDVIDEFGTDVKFFDAQGWHVCVEAKVNERAMVQFAKNFAPDVIILQPKRLAEEIVKEAKKTCASYWSHLEIE